MGTAQDLRDCMLGTPATPSSLRGPSLLRSCPTPMTRTRLPRVSPAQLFASSQRFWEAANGRCPASAPGLRISPSADASSRLAAISIVACRRQGRWTRSCGQEGGGAAGRGAAIHAELSVWSRARPWTRPRWQGQGIMHARTAGFSAFSSVSRLCICMQSRRWQEAGKAATSLTAGRWSRWQLCRARRLACIACLLDTAPFSPTNSVGACFLSGGAATASSAVHAELPAAVNKGLTHAAVHSYLKAAT